MNKTILTAALLLAFSSNTYAQFQQTQEKEPCAYTLMQNMIRNARSHEQIFNLIRENVPIDDPTITCGGSLLQLAVRRGNPNIVNGILTQDPKRVSSLASTKDFDIPEAPDQIPIVLFAAYYAPSETLFQLFMTHGADVTVRDEKGRDILWYLEQNPVLRRSDTVSDVQELMKQQWLKGVRDQVRAVAEAEEQAMITGQTDSGEAPLIPDDTLQQISAPDINDSTLAVP